MNLDSAPLGLKTDLDNILKIVTHFGYESQFLKLAEESGELIRAIARFLSPKKQGSEITLHKNIIEEMADVWIMMSQVCTLLACGDSVEKVVREKISRTLRRIETESKMKGSWVPFSDSTISEKTENI